MKRMDEVLDAATSRFRYDAGLREEIVRELRAHLEDSIAAARADGMDEAQAEEAAVRAFGDPEEIGEKLWQANRRRMRLRLPPIFLGASAILSLTFLAVWLCSYYTGIGIIPLPFHADVRIWRGSVEWHHTYAFTPVTPEEDWSPYPLPTRFIAWKKTKTYLGFGFSTGHEQPHVGNLDSGARREPERLKLFGIGKYSILLTPLWFVVLLLAWPWFLVLRRRFKRQSGDRAGESPNA